MHCSILNYSVILNHCFLGMSELTQSTRAQIVLLKEMLFCERRIVLFCGYTEREIAPRLSISKTAVHVTIVRYQKTGDYSSLPRSARKRKTSSQIDRLIRRLSKPIIQGLLTDSSSHAFLRKRHQSVCQQWNADCKRISACAHTGYAKSQNYQLKIPKTVCNFVALT